ERFAGSATHYTFVSSISVYVDPSVPVAETAPVATLVDPGVEQVTGETYGGLKALCERAVVDAFGERALVVRPGLIVGPHDPTDRFTWWVRRVARGGEVLAPGRPEAPAQVIDARDLAAWTIRMAERGAGGTFNATGPARRLTLGELLDACRAATGSDARFSWVDEAFLLERGVQPWDELPIWVPASHAGMLQADVARAVT